MAPWEKTCLKIDAWKNGVTGTEVFQITKDGCCQVKRPGNEEEKSKSFAETQ